MRTFPARSSTVLAALLLAAAAAVPLAATAEAAGGLSLWGSLTEGGWKTLKLHSDGAGLTFVVAGAGKMGASAGIFLRGPWLPNGHVGTILWQNGEVYASADAQPEGADEFFVEVGQPVPSDYVPVGTGFTPTSLAPGDYELAVWADGDLEFALWSLNAPEGVTLLGELAGEGTFMRTESDLRGTLAVDALVARASVDAAYAIEVQRTLIGNYLDLGYGYDLDMRVATPTGDRVCTAPIPVVTVRMCQFLGDPTPPGTYTFHATGAQAVLPNLMLVAADVTFP